MLISRHNHLTAALRQVEAYLIHIGKLIRLILCCTMTMGSYPGHLGRFQETLGLPFMSPLTNETAIERYVYLLLLFSHLEYCLAITLIAGYQQVEM